jgi:hypothetical protein
MHKIHIEINNVLMVISTLFNCSIDLDFAFILNDIALLPILLFS